MSGLFSWLFNVLASLFMAAPDDAEDSPRRVPSPPPPEPVAGSHILNVLFALVEGSFQCIHTDPCPERRTLLRSQAALFLGCALLSGQCGASDGGFFFGVADLEPALRNEIIRLGYVMNELAPDMYHVAFVPVF